MPPTAASAGEDTTTMSCPGIRGPESPPAPSAPYGAEGAGGLSGPRIPGHDMVVVSSPAEAAVGGIVPRRGGRARVASSHGWLGWPAGWPGPVTRERKEGYLW